MNAEAVTEVTNTPFFMTRADGMSEAYVEAAIKLATMSFQTLSGTQLAALDAPARKPWADAENRAVAREVAWYVDGAQEIAELILPDLGVDPEPLRIEAETALQGGRKLRMVTMPIESWNDGLIFRLLWGNVLLGQLSAVVGSNYIPYANVAQKLYFNFCTIDWPAKVGAPYVDQVKRAIQEDGKPALQKALDKWWPLALESFGQDGSKNERTYLELGIKTRPNAMCRDLFMRAVMRDLDEIGLVPPK